MTALRQDPERLAPKTILLDVVRSLGRFVWVLILFAFFSLSGRGSDRSELIFAFIAIFSFVEPLYRWLVIRYSVENGILYVRKLGLFRSEKSVPLDRIQSVNLERNLGHQLLGLAKLKIDTGATGTSAEVELDSLEVHHAEAFRKQLLGESTVAPPGIAAPPREILWRASAHDLNLLGITDNAWPIIIGAALPMIHFADAGSLLRGVDTSTAAVIGFAGLLLFAGWILSLGRTWLRYYGFELEHEGGRLSRSYGLLQQKRHSVAIRRVQALRWRTTWLRRRWNLWRIEALTAGAAQVEKEDLGGVLFPIIGERDALRLSEMALPDLMDRPLIWRGIPSRAFWVHLPSSLFWWQVPAMGYAAWQGWFWLGATIPAALLCSLVATWLHVRNLRFALFGRFVGSQAGVLRPYRLIVPLDKLQSVSLTESWLERRLGLATVHLHAAAGVGAVTLPNLPAELAARLAPRATRAVALTGAWTPDGV